MKQPKNINNFIQWTKIKIRLHFGVKSNKLYFKEREIWWASLGVNIGFEQDGKNINFERPILVLKKFGRETLWALPLTSKDRTGRFYYQFEHQGQKYSAILSQLRLISSKRLLRKIRRLPENDFKAIKQGIKDLL